MITEVRGRKSEATILISDLLWHLDYRQLNHMPRYTPATIEPKWQRYWDENKTFTTPDMPKRQQEAVRARYVPLSERRRAARRASRRATRRPTSSAASRGCRARACCTRWASTPSACRPKSTRSRPNTPPRVNTEKNIATFRRQLKMLGFSYDWDRELATTDVEYFRWTQWIFLVLFDTWFDAEQQTGRPISELPIPAEVKSQGDDGGSHVSGRASAGVSNRSAGELVPGAGHRAGQRRSRSTARANAAATRSCACRCGNGCCGSRPMPTGWRKIWSRSIGPKGIKTLQRNWIGRSTGAEVDFYIGQRRQTSKSARSVEAIAVRSLEMRQRAKIGFPAKARRRCPAHLHDAARHALRRDVHGDRAGASVRRAADDAGAESGRRSLLRSGREQERPRPHRTGQEEDRRLHRLAMPSIR